MVHTQKRFDRLIELMETEPIIACDFETDSLNVDEAKVVGLVICFDLDRSFYVPVGHKVDEHMNLSMDHLKILLDMLSKKTTVWFNWAYDGHVLKMLGYNIDEWEYIDMMPTMWLTDTNWKENSLKWYEKHNRS